MKKLLASNKNMKRALLCFIFNLSFFNFCTAQQWDSLEAGIIGYSGEGNGVWSQVAYNNNLYVGGVFYRAGNRTVSNIAKWNGINWFNVDTGTNQVGAVLSLCVYTGDLYAGGYFDSIGGKAIGCIAKWNGITWSAVGIGIQNDSGAIWSMCVYNGELYVGGIFDSIGGIAAKNIARWNGTTWSAVGLGIKSIRRTSYIPVGVLSLCIYQGGLYAGGAFDSAGGIPVENIAKWDGINWSGLGSGVNGNVNAIVVYNNSLYIGGGFDTVGGKQINDIATWNGLNWSSVGSGIPYAYKHFTRPVESLCVYDSSVIVGGNFDTAGTMHVQNIAFWNGTNWGTLASGIGSASYTVNSLYSFNSILYAGGSFLTAGGIPVNNIAQWSGPLGINQLRVNDEQITIYPNPGNGIFTFKIKDEQLSNSIIEVYNMLGEKVLTTELKEGSKGAIDISSQPDGVYFYKLVTNNGASISEGKLVIAK